MSLKITTKTSFADKKILYNFLDGDICKSNFEISIFPACCMAGIISNINFIKCSENDLNQIKKKIEEIMYNCGYSIMYATHVVGTSTYNMLLELGFIPVDMNHNVNTDNNVAILKYMYEWGK